MLRLPALRLVAAALALALGACIPELSIPAPEPSTACDLNELDILLDAFEPCAPGVCGDSPAAGLDARCVPVGLVNEQDRADLLPCQKPMHLCVPRKFLISGGRYTPAACSSSGGIEGRCLSVCLSSVNADADLLPTLGCEPGEVCAPCYNPSTNLREKTCETSTCDTPKQAKPDWCSLDYDLYPLTDLTKLESCSDLCGAGSAHCVPLRNVGTSDAEKLKDCVDPNFKCVPDPLIVSGGYRSGKPCSTLKGRAEGRCQSLCIQEVADQKDSLDQDVCAADERCAPCFDPSDGTDTGACTAKGCDQPVAAPFIFPSCCEARAKCVPTDTIPEAKRGSFLDRECAASNLCVPNEYVTSPSYAGPRCTTDDSKAPGACVSTCLDGVAQAPRAYLGLVGPAGKPDDECGTGAYCVPCKVSLGSAELDFFGDIIGLTNTKACDPP